MWPLPEIFQTELTAQSSNVINGPGESILRLCEATGCSFPSNSKVSAGLLAEQKISEHNKARCRSAKRKIKRKIRRNNLFKLYEKNQEKISYRKAQLLLEKAETRQLNAKINKDHCYIINSSKLRTHLRKSTRKGSHLHNSESKQAPSHKMQDGECSKVQHPRLKQVSRDLFAECDSHTRWSVFIHDFWWHRWLTSIASPESLVRGSSVSLFRDM